MLLRNLEDALQRSTRSPGHEVIAETVTSVMDAHRTAPTDLTMPVLVDNFLTDMCEAQDRVPTVSRFSEDTGYIHASALTNLCARQYALARRHDVVVQSSPTGAMRIVWEIGLALERHVVRQVAASMGTDDVVVGLELRDEEYMVMGRPDLLFTIHDDVTVVAETKTMNVQDFENLTSPLADHVLQAALYRWLLRRNQSRYRVRVHDHVVLLYVCKDYRWGGVYKEFHVDVNHRLVRSNVAMALELALELKVAMDRNGIPRRTICAIQNCTRARGCPVATLCFNTSAEAT